MPSGARLALDLTTTRVGCVAADRVEVGLDAGSLAFEELELDVCRGAAVLRSPIRVAVAH